MEHQWINLYTEVNVIVWNIKNFTIIYWIVSHWCQCKNEWNIREFKSIMNGTHWPQCYNEWITLNVDWDISECYIERKPTEVHVMGRDINALDVIILTKIALCICYWIDLMWIQYYIDCYVNGVAAY